MKRILALIFVCLLLAVTSVPSFAAEAIDPARESSLTLQYKNGNEFFEGTEVKVYRIATVNADGTYDLTDQFKKYPVNIYGITTYEEWAEIASTLEAYILADGIGTDLSAVTNSMGEVYFAGIAPGMYLTLSVRVEREEKITVFESFITAVPGISDDGDHLYDVSAYPKSESIVPEKKEVEFKAVKQWKDTGNTDRRPDSVKIDILRNGDVEYSVELTEDNNWSYRWTAEDDGSVWTVVERDIPGDYTVLVTDDGYTFLITNVSNYSGGKPPQTGDTTMVWPYALGMCLSGAVLLVLAIWRKRSAE